MKIQIEEDASLEELEITIRCKQTNDAVIRLLEMLRMTDKKLTGHKENRTYLLDVNQILYIDTVEKKTFLYTEQEVYETPLRLYELEERLEEYGFFRVSKSFLIHLSGIQSLKADIDRRIRITMSNGEQIIASRQYADELKKRLGVR